MNIFNILQSGDVVRFHAREGIDKQKNSEHQWGVALIVQHIYPSCSKELLLCALTHDCHEHYTGDIPANVKWDNPTLSKILSDIERKWEEDNGISFNLNQEEQFALKIADTLEGMLYCVRQVQMGHTTAKFPFDGWKSFLTEFIGKERRTTNNSTVRRMIKNADFIALQIIREMGKSYGTE